MKHNEEMITFDDQVFDQLCRISIGISRFKSNTSHVSTLTHLAIQSITNTRVQSILLSNAVKGIKDVQTYRKNAATYSEISEEVLVAQIVSLSAISDRIEERFENMHHELSHLAATTDKWIENIDAMMTDKVMEIIVKGNELTHEQKKAKIRELAETTKLDNYTSLSSPKDNPFSR